MDKLTASEAVYGFAAWLTTREEVTTLGTKHDCAPIPALIDKFCKANDLDEPREDWHVNLCHPTEPQEVSSNACSTCDHWNGTGFCNRGATGFPAPPEHGCENYQKQEATHDRDEA